MTQVLSLLDQEQETAAFPATAMRVARSRGAVRHDSVPAREADHPLSRPSPFKNYLHSAAGAFAEGHYTEF